jgi:hypothetical protein
MSNPNPDPQVTPVVPLPGLADAIANVVAALKAVTDQMTPNAWPTPGEASVFFARYDEQVVAATEAIAIADTYALDLLEGYRGLAITWAHTCQQRGRVA